MRYIFTRLGSGQKYSFTPKILGIRRFKSTHLNGHIKPKLHGKGIICALLLRPKVVLHELNRRIAVERDAP